MGAKVYLNNACKAVGVNLVIYFLINDCSDKSKSVKLRWTLKPINRKKLSLNCFHYSEVNRIL